MVGYPDLVIHRPLLYPETSSFGFCLDDEPRNLLRREAATPEEVLEYED